MIQRNRRIVGEVLRAPQSFLFATVPDKQNRALRFLLRMRDRLCHAKYGSCAGAVIVSAIANWVGRAGRADADMIVMRADGDILIFQFWIGAFPNSDHVLGHDMRRSHTYRQAYVLSRV